MTPASLFQRTPPDISVLEERQDIAGLIRALSSRDPKIQTDAAAVLARIGPAAMEPLVNALKTKNRTLRLGAISALAEIRDALAFDALVATTQDTSNEIRWQACIALGEMGDLRAVPSLLETLRDKDKYVRYASALSLEKIGYCPKTDEERAYVLAGMQDWENLTGLNAAAVPATQNLLSDSDPEVRRRAAEVLGAVGSSDAAPALVRALADEDRQVRWAATLASRKCGVPSMELPRGLCRRPRLRKNPLIAGFLNFLLPGLGYGYLGKWWGIMIFQIDITVTVWLFKYSGEANTYSILFPFYLLLGVHAWYITKLMPEEPP